MGFESLTGYPSLFKTKEAAFDDGADGEKGDKGLNSKEKDKALETLCMEFSKLVQSVSKVN